MAYRSRFIDVDKSLCATQWFTVFGGPPANIQLTYTDLHGIEQVFDTSPHKYITGGGFQMQRSTVKSRPATVFAFTQTGGIDYFYSGKIHAKQYAGNNPQFPQPILQSTMLGHGVQGWHRFKPTARHGSLAQGILELKDVPHMLKQASELKNVFEFAKNMMRQRPASFAGGLDNLDHYSRYIAKQGGSHYLNYQFGLRPLLNDVRQTVRNAFDVQKRLNQLARDNGKWVRRSGTVDQDVATQSTVNTGSFSSPSMPAPLYQGQEIQYRTQTQRARYWFSGKFKYWIKPVAEGDLVGKFFQAEHVNRILYGTDLSVSLLYELMPWSWLVDWFSSAGDSIANFSEDSADNLVADYAFVMGNIMTSDMYVVQGKTVNGQVYEATQEYLTEVKQRTEATPYGFYAIPPLLSGKQISILAALGFSHLPRRI